LVNLIARKQVVKELLQNEMNADNIVKELLELIENTTYRTQILTDYKQIKNALGYENTAEKAAGLILSYLKTS
jgi:lipid-A-disaccharide synthase